MESTDLIRIIREALDKEIGPEFTSSPIIYDPMKMQYKVSVALLEESEEGLSKRFNITVDEIKRISFY